eukprot:COSAG01_NODE_12000_length_1818_cov_4.058946_2_plen_224_part_00
MTAFFARGGVMSSLGEEGGHPVKPRSGQGDHQTGLACCTAVLGALLLRQKTGKGSLAEASLIRSATWNLVRAWSTVAFVALGLAGWLRDLYFSLGFGGGLASQGEDLAATLVDRAQPKKTELESEMVMQRCYECADGRWMIIMMPFREEYYWPRFAQALGCPEWAEAGHAYADRAQRYRDRRDLGKQIAAIIAQGGSTDLPIPHLWQITTLSLSRARTTAWTA